MHPSVEARVSPRAFWPAAVADEILRRVSLGEPLAIVCAEDGMPSRQSFYNWLVADPMLSSRYTAAVRTSVERRCGIKEGVQS